ncbi:MAG: hypothetical protein ACLUZZ_05925, partial [Alistipes inops]
IVEAPSPVWRAMTFAARQVGASITGFILNFLSVATNAAMMDVLPVPAYPLRMKMRSVSASESHEASASMIFFCPSVGANAKFA